MTNHVLPMDVTIAIDCMGGDHGPSVTLPAALNYLKHDPKAAVILVCLKEAMESAITEDRAAFGERLRIRHASEFVGMDESPASALRFKKDSSMRVAIDLVKNGEA